MSLKAIKLYDTGHGDRADVFYTFYWAVWAKNVVVDRETEPGQGNCLMTKTPEAARALYRQLKKRGVEPCVTGPRNIRRYQIEWNSRKIQSVRTALVAP